MSDGFRATLIKILTIIGFSATLFLIVWLVIYFVAHTPKIFSNLANIVREKEDVQLTSNEPKQNQSTSTPKNDGREESSTKKPDTGVSIDDAPARVRSPATARHTPQATIDIATTIHGIGVYDSKSAFHYQDTYDTHKDMYVLVEMVNLGTAPSGHWTFRVLMNNHVLYTAPIQTPLSANEHIVFPIPLDIPIHEHSITLSATANTTNDIHVENNTDTITRRVR